MNCFYISTTICVIVIAAIILMNIMADYVIKKQSSKSEQQLNEFCNEANKTKQDLDIMLNLAMHNVGHGKRYRRQAIDFFDSSDTEKEAEVQMVPNCNLDFCKNGNCEKVWYSNRIKNSLYPIKQFNNFLSSSKEHNGKMSRETHSLDSEPTGDDEENAWKSVEETEGAVREGSKAENKEGNEMAHKHNNSSKGNSKSGNNSKGNKSKKFSWSEIGEETKFPADDEDLKENSNIFDGEINIIRSSPDAEYSNSDVSSCQHCSQNGNNGILKNNLKSYKAKSIDAYGNESQNPKSISKPTKKGDSQQPFLKSFQRKYSIEDPENEAEEEELNNLCHIKYPAVALTQSEQENDNQSKNCKPIAAGSDTHNKASLNGSQLVLNDQLENSKNNLSHEANYKLSKDEQDASENKKGFSWKWGIFKRSHPFNAMNEIKLKTSRRLMQKGFGASLPSYSLGETRKEIMIDNMLKRREKEMLKEKSRRYKNFEESFKNNELEDESDMPLEAAGGSQPLKDWTSNRKKRISDPSARYKRELKEIGDKDEAKAFNKSIRPLESNFELFSSGNNLTNTETVEFPNESNNSVNAKPNKMPNFFTGFIVNDNIKVQRGEGKYKDIGKTAFKTLDSASPFELKLQPFVDQAHINNSLILSSESLPLQNSSLELATKALKAQNFYLSYYKPLKRIKRTIRRNSSNLKALNNKNPKLALNKSKISKKYNTSFYARNKYFVKPVQQHARVSKMSQHAKRFNPIQTLKLKKYKKFHTPRALKRTDMNGESNVRDFKNNQRIKKKRSLQYTFLTAKNSAGSGSFISTARKILWRKVRYIKESIQCFFKSMKYLPLQRSVTKAHESKSEAVASENVLPLGVAKSYKYAENQVQQALASEKFHHKALDITKSYENGEAELYKDQSLSKSNAFDQEAKVHFRQNYNKIRNPKLRFLKNKANNFFLLKEDLKSDNIRYFKELNKARQKRALKALSENYTSGDNSILSMIWNGADHNINTFKIFWAKEYENISSKSTFEIFIDKTNAFIRFLKALLTQSFFQKKNMTNIDQSFPKKCQSSGVNKNSAQSSSPEKSFICHNLKVKSYQDNFNNYSNGNGANNTKNELSQHNEENKSKSLHHDNLETNTIAFKGNSKQMKNKFIAYNIFREKLYPLSSLNESYGKEQGQKRAFDMRKRNHNPTLRFKESFALKKRSSEKPPFEKDVSEKITSFNRTLSLNESFHIHSDNLNYSKIQFRILPGKTNPQQLTRNLKRSKRSLMKDPQEDHIESDNVKHFNKRSYFFHHGDLYNTDTDIPYNKPQNVQNLFNEPQQLFGNEPMPIDQKQDKSTVGNNFQKLYDPLASNNLNTNYPAHQKFQPMKFDNVWHDGKARKRHGQSSSSKYRTLKNLRKRNHFDHLKNSLTGNKTKNMLTNSTKLSVKDAYLSELTDFKKNYKFDENMFDWSTAHATSQMNGQNSSTDDNGKLSLELQDKILNCKEFSNLEEFIKSLPKNITQSLMGATTESKLDSFTEKIEMDIKTSIITTELETTEEPLISDSTIKCSTTTEVQMVDDQTETSIEPTEEFTQPDEMDLEQTTESTSPDEESDTSSTDSVLENVTTEHATTEHVPPTADKQDDIKLNITIKASVHGNSRDNHYFGNGSFDAIPGFMDDRRRRQIFASPEPARYRKIRQKSRDEDNDEELNDLMSGKLSAKIVNNIFDSVQQSPHLKELWPILKRDQPEENKAQQPNFYAIRNQQNEEQLQNSEKLLDQVMSSINTIIEQQARAKTCVPLRPDLQEFYNMILQSRQQQDMVREKRHPAEAKQRKVLDYNNPSLDPNKIEQETRIVKKLLKKYDELPQEDQQQVAVVRDDLIKNLMVLHRLQDNEIQEEHDSRDRRENMWDVSDEEILKSLQSQYSPQFFKLLDGAELYRRINGN